MLDAKYLLVTTRSVYSIYFDKQKHVNINRWLFLAILLQHLYTRQMRLDHDLTRLSRLQGTAECEHNICYSNSLGISRFRNISRVIHYQLKRYIYRGGNMRGARSAVPLTFYMRLQPNFPRSTSTSIFLALVD